MQSNYLVVVDIAYEIINAITLRTIVFTAGLKDAKSHAY